MEEEKQKKQEKKNKEETRKKEEEKKEIKKQTEKEKTETLEKKNKELEELLKRLQADFDNYIKRTEKEKEKCQEQTKITFFKELLSIMDSIEAGIIAEKNEDSESFKGLLLIHEELKKLFEKNNIIEIKALDEEFNPQFHEALMQRETEEKDKNKIIEVLQKGYLYKNIILRHSKVIVGK